MKIITSILVTVWVASVTARGEEVTGNWSRIEKEIREHAEEMADACVSIRARNGAWGGS